MIAGGAALVAPAVFRGAWLNFLDDIRQVNNLDFSLDLALDSTAGRLRFFSAYAADRKGVLAA